MALDFLKDTDLGIGSGQLETEEEEPETEKDLHELLQRQIKHNVSSIFVRIHTSVIDASERMRVEQKRHNYVTPTNYIELVTGYVELLSEKRAVVGDMASKLENGLNTLENARRDVQEMSVKLEQQKIDAARNEKECEDLVVVILEQKTEADNRKQQVEIDRANIQREKQVAERIQREAQLELDEALPALQAAEAALDTLDANDFSEISRYTNPAKALVNVMETVMIVLKKKPDYAEAKTMLRDPRGFKATLLNFDKDNMSDSVLRAIGKKVADPDFKPDIVARSSKAGAGICAWVVAIEIYGRIAKNVKPKQERVAAAKTEVEQNEKRLSIAEHQLKEVTEKVQRLTQQLDEKTREKNMILKIKQETEIKLDRAQQLVEGLEDERERWSHSIKEYRSQLHNLIGDVLLAAAFLSYAGPFDSSSRDTLKKIWKKEVSRHKIPVSANFSFENFLVRQTDIRTWTTVQGLPSDSFSIENGALVTRGRRWPLMIDPQYQANRWIKKLGGKTMQVTDFKKKDILRTLETAVKFGFPVLVQDILEDIDPALEPLLSKAIINRGGQQVIKIGDREVDYNPGFRLYFTTRFSNPHYTPEISTKVSDEGLCSLCSLPYSPIQPEACLSLFFFKSYQTIDNNNKFRSDAPGT